MNSPIAQFKPAELAEQSASMPAVRMGFGSLQGFELMQRGAKLLAASTLVPKDYQNNLSNCVIALNMADRLGADPLMVMQNLYIVHGRPGWSAQFLIATFNQCGRFSAIRYKWGGTEGQDDWSCQAFATERENGDVITGPTISIALSKKEGWYSKGGSKWQSIPQLMLMYRAASWLVRTHAPEISMGLQTAEEIHDVYDAERDIDGNYQVSETSKALEKIREVSSGAAIEKQGEQINTQTGEVTKAETAAVAEEKPEVKAPAKKESQPVISYTDAAAALTTSKTLDDLNEAMDLARGVANATHRKQLDSIYEECAAKLNGADPL